MIIRILRWIARLDRSYFFALASLVTAVIVSVGLAVVPVNQQDDGTSTTLVATGGAIVFLLLALPVMVLAPPLFVLPRAPGPRLRSEKVNSGASTFVLVAFVLVSLPSLGIFYVPALIFSIASTVSLFFGKDRGLEVAARSAARHTGNEEQAGEVRLSRSARRKLRQEEGENSQLEEPVQASPLTSSRRRRGRSRRKR